eukprot:4354916-Pleurochrysis_carterae.AAC.1
MPRVLSTLATGRMPKLATGLSRCRHSSLGLTYRNLLTLALACRSKSFLDCVGACGAVFRLGLSLDAARPPRPLSLALLQTASRAFYFGPRFVVCF